MSDYSGSSHLVIRENSLDSDKRREFSVFEKVENDASTITTRGSWGDQELSLKQLVDLDYYDQSTGMVLSQNKKYNFSLLEAIEKGWVSKDSVELYDPRTKKVMKLTEASVRGIIDLDNGNIVDSSKEMVISFKDSINKALEIRSKSNQDTTDNSKVKPQQLQSVTLCDAFARNLFNPQTKLFEFQNGTQLSLKDSLNSKYLDSSRTMVRDPSTSQKVPFDLLVSLGLIDLQNAIIKDSQGKQIPIEAAHTSNVIFPSEGTPGPMSLMRLFEDGYYHPEMNMFFDLTSKKYVSLGEAIDKQLLDAKSILRVNNRTNEVLGMKDAFQSGLIDPHSGLTKEGFKLIDAFERNDILIKPLAITKAVELNLLNETTGKFLDPSHRRFFSLEQSLKEGFINPESTLINPADRKPITVTQAIREGILDSTTGMVTNLSTGETLTLREVYNSSKFMKASQTSPGDLPRADNIPHVEAEIEAISHAVQQSYAPTKLIYKASSNSFVDPLTEESLTLEGAISKNYIDPKHCLLLIPGLNELVMLQKLMENKMIDLVTGNIYNTKQNISYSFKEVLHDKHLLNVVYDDYSLAEAIDLEIFNPETGSFTDPNTKKNISLKESFSKKLISPLKSVVIVDKQSFNLSEAMERGLMDERTADVLIDGQRTAYIDALQNGIVLDSYVPLKLSFNETLQTNLFDKKLKRFIHPISRQNIDLAEALESEFLESDKSFMYLPDSQKQISLSEAASQGLLSKDLTTVADPSTGKEFNVIIQLLQATHQRKKSKGASGVEKSNVEGVKKERLTSFDSQDTAPIDVGSLWLKGLLFKPHLLAGASKITCKQHSFKEREGC